MVCAGDFVWGSGSGNVREIHLWRASRLFVRASGILSAGQARHGLGEERAKALSRVVSEGWMFACVEVERQAWARYFWKL